MPSSAANTVAVLAFTLAGAVCWPQTLTSLACGLLGGIGGARLGRVMPPGVTRLLTLCWTTAITGVFSVHTYLRRP
jgi:uncharacterized protein